MEKNTGKRQVVVFAWGKHANHRLGGCDARSHHSPRENLLLTAYITKKRIEVRRTGGRVEEHRRKIERQTRLIWAGLLSIHRDTWGLNPLLSHTMTADQLKMIAAGGAHNLVLTTNGTCLAWGAGKPQQLEIGYL